MPKEHFSTGVTPWFFTHLKNDDKNDKRLKKMVTLLKDRKVTLILLTMKPTQIKSSKTKRVSLPIIYILIQELVSTILKKC